MDCYDNNIALGAQRNKLKCNTVARLLEIGCSVHTRRRYEGELVRGSMDGYGVYVWADGS